MSPVRTHFCESARRLPSGCGSPSRYGTSGCMPAVVNSTVGSFSGRSEADGMILCPCRSKNVKNFLRMSLPVISVACRLWRIAYRVRFAISDRLFALPAHVAETAVGGLRAVEEDLEIRPEAA